MSNKDHENINTYI